MSLKKLALDGNEILEVEVSGKTIQFKQLNVLESSTIERKYSENNDEMLRRKLYAMLFKVDNTLTWENYEDISEQTEKELLVKVYGYIAKHNSDFQKQPKVKKE